MATTTKSLKTFSGTEDEDVITWLEEISFITKLLRYTEEDTVRTTLLQLRGVALSWATEVLGARANELNFERLRSALVNRFGSQQRTDLSLSRFLTAPSPKTRGEYTSFLNDASILFKKNYMNIVPLTQVVINKSPGDMKALLLQAAETAQSWDSFIKRAENVAWIAFPDHTLNRVEQDQRTHESSGKMYCEWHEVNTHDTKDCVTLKKVKEKYKETERYNKTKQSKTQKNTKYTQRKKVYAVESQVSDNEDSIQGETPQENKNLFFYTVNRLRSHNPFFIKLYQKNKTHECLLDTGADISIISEKLVSSLNKVTIKKKGGNLRSACGTPIEILGQIEDIDFTTISNGKVKVSPYVVRNGPEYIILGKEFIVQHPEILKDCLNSKIKLKYKTKRVNQILNEDLCKKHAEVIIKENEEMFNTEITEMNVCTRGVHTIQTLSNKPIRNRNGRIPIYWEKDISEEIKKNLRLGIIRKSHSPWCSRIVPAPKPDGSVRMCIDYRPLNKISIKDSYPLPRIDDILDSLGGAKIFTTLDATSGYYQIEMAEEDKEKTAFAFKGGLYEFNRMPFGLCNAPATFQRAMDVILEDFRGEFVLPYLDDIIIYSPSIQDHESHVKEVMKRLKEAGLTLNKNKCKFFKKELKVLGSIISEGKVKPDPEKIEGIKRFPAPKTLKELRSFIGVTNFGSAYIPGYTNIMRPLFNYLRGENKNSQKAIKLNKEALEAFKNIKARIADNLERAQPDFKKEFILTTDASDIGIGAILTQKDAAGREQMIAAFSKSLDKAQKNYSVTDKELLGIVKSIEHFRHYLLGKQFTLRTDHKALAYMWEAKNPCSRILRWSLKLQEYCFKVEYIKGENNVADALSRIPAVNEIRLRTTEVKNQKDRNEILKQYHLASGHGSSNTMNFLIRNRYWWDSLGNDIKSVIKSCETCLKAGGPTPNTQHRVIETTRPNELWEVDLIGRIPTEDGNRFIFVAIDHFTKWVEAKVIKNKNEETIEKCIKKLIIQKHGKPTRIVSDCGLEFKNNRIQTLARTLGIKWEFASPAHHQTIGAVERANQTLWQKIRKLSEFGDNDWEKKVGIAARATNISFNRAIKTSPFILKYGKLPTLEIDKKLGHITQELDHERILAKVYQNRKNYRREIEKGKKRAKDTFRIGDRVLVYKKQLSDKIKAEWIPGYTILEKIEPDAYIVTKGTSKCRLNKSHLKPDGSQSQ
ncbi:Retrovirus-related Pol polyprotein from transposon [Nosema granulosis]|uniref:RNA-directed DNA polymerase n=1 Tax=Nosema granulosis TaxID=83296 RepID=A0A9P6GVX9_9MICR|nr:Retrovirus-related Pol polyprotein from transposon [Nosema granulosis]